MLLTNKKSISKLFSFFLITLTLIVSMLSTPQAYAAGEIEIVSWEDLADISGDLDGDYILMNDLGPLDAGYDTFASSTSNGGAGWTPLGNSGIPFSGTFDGQGHSITGLTIITTSSGIGLFAEVSGATIRDVELIDVDIAVDSGAQNVGAIAGRVSGSTVENVQTSGTISGFGHYVGGIIGQMYDTDPEVSSILADSSSTVDIESSGTTIGGAVGYLDAQNINTTIRNTHVSGNVTADYNVGGLVGYMQLGTIRESSAEGDVSAYDADGFRIGGLVGYMDTGSFVFNSYATGNVSGQIDIGGLIGRSWFGIVANTFSLGTVTETGGGSDIGGFIGETDTPASYSVTGSFWDDEVNPTLSGIPDGNAGLGVVGINTADFASQTDFVQMGWDFDNVWEMGGAHPEIRSNLTYFEGAGTEEDPYLVGESCAQLASVRFFPSAHFELTQDIDCSETADWHSGAGFMGLSLPYDGHKFTGNFDGNDHTISGVTTNTPDDDYVGFFRHIDAGAEVYDLTLDDVNMIGDYYVGALAGSLEGTVTNVHAIGYVEGNYATGGLVGVHAENYGVNNSSPLVYSWDGDSYEYVADVGEMISRGTDGEDFTVIDSDKIAPKGDVYSINISQEYNEIVYYDKLSLMTFEHAPGYTVVEPMMREISYNSLTTVSDTPSNPLLSCVDMYGNDCLNDLKNYDDKWSHKDKTEVNEWIMDFGDLSSAERVQLVLRAARDYAATPEYDHRTVSVMGPDGQWVQIYGRKELASDGTPRLRTIDLTGKFLTNDYRVKFGFDRLRVNSVAIDTSPEQAFTMQEIQPSKAELSFRGYTAIDNTYFNDHDYENVSGVPSEMFANQIGNFTKYGDVLPLLTEAEDRFVIMRHGDYIAFEFPYDASITQGKERSYILFSDVVYKHANEETGRTVNPLPFQGMKSYPTEGYPMTPENIEYLNTWNTRVYGGPIGGGSTIIDSSADVDVIGGNYVGGLVGFNEKLITGSYATGYVYASSNYAGGLVGSSQSNGRIEESYADNSYPEDEGIVVIGQAPVESACNVGGFSGYLGNGGVIINSFTRSDVYTSGSCYAGGFTSEISASTIENSYTTSYVSGEVGATIGGFAGVASVPDIINSFWHSELNPDVEGCGLEENDDCDALGSLTGKTQTELKTLDVFTTALGVDSWDFDTIWGINTTDNDGYPFFRWQGFTHNPGGETEEEEPVRRPLVSGSRGVARQSNVINTPASPMVRATTEPAPKLCAVPLYPTKSIKMGAQNDPEQVKLLEQFLNQFENANLSVDGIYSSLDEAAVKKWQDKYASEILTPWGAKSGTGYIFTTSLAKLRSIFLENCSVTETTSQAVASVVRDLQVGASGSDVRSLQSLLVGQGYEIPSGATGFFGAQTKSALIKYQSKNSITPAIGFFGAQTRAQMKSSGLTGLWW